MTLQERVVRQMSQRLTISHSLFEMSMKIIKIIINLIKIMVK